MNSDGTKISAVALAIGVALIVGGLLIFVPDAEVFTFGQKNFSTVEYNKCEYVLFHSGGPSHAIVHKGNCKFCVSRGWRP